MVGMGGMRRRERWGVWIWANLRHKFSHFVRALANDCRCHLNWSLNRECSYVISHSISWDRDNHTSLFTEWINFQKPIGVRKISMIIPCPAPRHVTWRGLKDETAAFGLGSIAHVRQAHGYNGRCRLTSTTRQIDWILRPKPPSWLREVTDYKINCSRYERLLFSSSVPYP